MKDIINHLEDNKREKLGEVVRFGVVGVAAVLIQYGVYLLLVLFMNHNISMTLGYIISFIFNFIASTHYTFRVKANAKRGAGFALSHVINYFMQITMLNVFIWLGISKQIAPMPMFGICVPVNFLLVRFFLKR
ncbi:MAG: GtrA family protein [Prevotella sp.]|nr:GtrA family protein [Prevotella sp.]